MSSKRPPTARQRLTSQRLRRAVQRVAKAHGVRGVRIFGSYARGEERRSSDVDLLVDLPEGASLFDLAGLKMDLEKALHRKVDVIPSDSIKPALRTRILADARSL